MKNKLKKAKPYLRIMAILVISNFTYAQNTTLQTLTLFNLYSFCDNAVEPTFGIVWPEVNDYKQPLLHYDETRRFTFYIPGRFFYRGHCAGEPHSTGQSVRQQSYYFTGRHCNACAGWQQ